MTQAKTKAGRSSVPLDPPVGRKPRKTHVDHLFERGAISAKVHAMLKAQEAAKKAAKENDAARIARAAIAKAMRPNS